MRNFPHDFKRAPAVETTDLFQQEQRRNGGSLVSKQFKYGVNFKVVGKTNPQKLSWAGAWQTQSGTMVDLAQHMQNGHPWMPALLDGNGKRWQSNANYAELGFADIDQGMTIQQALEHPFISAHCCLGIESASSTPDHHKLRLVFAYAQPVYGWRNIRTCQEYLIHRLKVADPACKDASRFSFGNSGQAPFLLQEGATLPLDFEQEALAWKAAEEEAAQQRYQEALARRQRYKVDPPGDTIERVRDALRFAPVRSPGCGNYPDCVAIAAGLLNEFGEATAISLLEEFIPPHLGSRDGWRPDRVVQGLKRGTTRSSRPATIGTVFHICQKYGFRFPERKQASCKDRQVTRDVWLEAKRRTSSGERRMQNDKGFGEDSDEKSELRPKKEREIYINKRRLTFLSNYWEAVKPDFLLGKADVEYEGYCPTIDIGLSRTHLIQGGLGAGKTTAIIRSLALANPDKLIIWVTKRNGLLYQTEARATEAGFACVEHYQHDVSGNRTLLEAGSEAFIGMADDSFKSYAVGGIDWKNTILVIDEFRSVRCEILNKPEVFPQFEKALREADTLIVADAFLNNIDRAILRPYRGSDRIIYRQKFRQSPKQIYWIEALTKDGRISFNHDGAYLELLDQFIQRNNIKVIAVDNLLVTNIIAYYLRQRGNRVKVVSSETVESNKVFMPEPDSILDAEQPDFLIFTPTAESGLDIQSKFDRGLLISTGTLCPINMLQMLGRGRQCYTWFVSAPRFTGGETPRINLDGKKVAAWGEKLGQVFNQLEAPTSSDTLAWGQWQELTRDIEKAFNSEYLYCLFEHYFESVETITLQSSRTAEWRDLRDKVQRESIIKILSANLENGQQMQQKKRQPTRDHEVWDLKLAEYYSRSPKVVKDLVARYQTVKDTPKLQVILQDWESVDALRQHMSFLSQMRIELEDQIELIREEIGVKQRILAEDPSDLEVATRLADLQQQEFELISKYKLLIDSHLADLRLLFAYNDECDEINQIIDNAKVFFSDRVEKLKRWRMAKRSTACEDLWSEFRRCRFTAASSPHWKQFAYTKLFKALDLEQLAVAESAKSDELTAHKDGFCKHSPIVENLWQQFNKLATLKELFPTVENKEGFWKLIGKVMRYMGFQSVNKKIRVETEELHPNGKDRRGRQRFSKSQVQHFIGWLVMERSGNKVFQELFETIIAEIDDWIDRDLAWQRDYRDRRKRDQQKAARWGAAA